MVPGTVRDVAVSVWSVALSMSDFADSMRYVQALRQLLRAMRVILCPPCVMRRCYVGFHILHVK